MYLHENNIIYRDTKPQNVGFDVRGDLKLFDFGLAKLLPSNDNYQDTYKLSMAGTPRFMAPEVLCEKSKGYNLKADVYSFMIDGRHPEINPYWPTSLIDIFEASFDQPHKRPTIKIRRELCDLRNGDDSTLKESDILRRRSVASIENDSPAKYPRSDRVKISYLLRSTLNEFSSKVST
ncbi:hypothetical protein ACHAXN_001445 [Cyclotella atomus]